MSNSTTPSVAQADKSRAVQPIRPAATVVLVRPAASSYEIFMLRRTGSAAFAGGMYVFPGGRVDGDDHLHKYDAVRSEPSADQHAQIAALGNEWRGFYIACLREHFEEAGLLLAYDRSGELLRFDDPVSHERFTAYREPLHSGAMSLRQICEAEGLTLAIDRVNYFNRFVTPLGRPRRFDTRFFIAAAPADQAGYHDDKETVDSIWISPQEALARNDAKEFDLMRVTRMQLESLSNSSSAADLVGWAAANRAFPVQRPAIPRDLPK